MKFIVMTNPGPENHFLDDLKEAGLQPEFIVTENPFHIQAGNPIKKWAKKIKRQLQFYKNKAEITAFYKPYFFAKKHNIPVFDTSLANSEFMAQKIKEAKIDYGFTFTFKILKPLAFEAPKNGFINFHPAFLPFNRGASPCNWAILKDQKETGITFHYIAKGVDTGAIIEQYKVPLSGFENAKILNDHLLNLGSHYFTKLAVRIQQGETPKSYTNPYTDGSYEPPYKKENRIISETMTATEIIRVTQASNNLNNGALYKEQLVSHAILLDDTIATDSKGTIIHSADHKKLLLVIK